MTTSVRVRERALAGILEMTQRMLRCAELNESRQVAIGHMCRLFDASGGVFVVPERSVPLSSDDAFVDGAVTDLPDVYGHYLHEDPGLPLLQRARLPRRPLVLTSDMFMSQGRLLRTRYYREVMQPRAMHHAMAIMLAADGAQHGVIALYRSQEQPPFVASDVAIAMTAIPAIASALYSLGRVVQAQETVHQSIAVLDERLDVLYRDTSGPRWLTEWLRGRWYETGEFASFASHCRALLSGSRTLTDVVVRLPRAGSSAGVAVDLRRIQPPGRPRLVLLLRPAENLERKPILGPGLSPREREVAELIAAGASHAEVAASLAVSVHTVAHHAGAVYRKTLAGNRKALAARAAAEQPSRGALAALTHREREVAALLRAGSSNKEIAGALQLSVATVSNHLQSIYRKLAVHDRVALIRRLSS